MQAGKDEHIPSKIIKLISQFSLFLGLLEVRRKILRKIQGEKKSLTGSNKLYSKFKVLRKEIKAMRGINTICMEIT